jgi:dGTPase
MAPYGGFDHNAQSFKVVTRLERKYASFDGLNLSFETLEGLAKHNGPLGGAGSGETVLARAIADAGVGAQLHLAAFGPAEGQVAAVADDIAYNSHDLEDGLRAGLFALEELADVPLAGPFVSEVPRGIETQRVIYEVNRRIITAMVDDVVCEAGQRLAGLAEPSLAGVRAAKDAVIALSPQRAAEMEGLKDYLYANVYRHPRITRIMADAERVVRDLFARYLAEPAEMPGPWQALAGEGDGGAARAAVAADFVAGMTDRFAIKEHRRLFDATPDLR